jgi:2-keto-4-pentenoate hydratase/2-oxohepta-3-ene-1,7-dioic acid hydratase in catechol pathway
VKILRYRDADGDRTGVIVGGGVLNVSSRAPELSDLRQAVTAAGRRRMAGLCAVGRPDVALNDVTLLAPLHREARIFCVGRNFADHVAELSTAAEPPQPRVFLRTHESVVGPGQVLERPTSSETFDFEGELAVVIGAVARAVPPEDALAHVAAYTCFDDGSVREFQRHTTTAGKNFDRSGAIGPWLVTADEIGDPEELELTTRLNGEVVQTATMDRMIYPIHHVIAYLSLITALLPGDVISMGTPSGVGSSRTPPRWLREGDRLDIDITRVGVLSVVVEPPSA